MEEPGAAYPADQPRLQHRRADRRPLPRIQPLRPRLRALIGGCGRPPQPRDQTTARQFQQQEMAAAAPRAALLLAAVRCTARARRTLPRCYTHRAATQSLPQSQRIA